MGDASGELAERGQLLGLHQAILRGAEFVDQGGELIRSRLHLVEQPHIFNRDHGLVGEAGDKFNLAICEGNWLAARQRKCADRLSAT